MNLTQQIHSPEVDSFNPTISPTISKKRDTIEPSINGFHDLGIAPKLMKEIDKLGFTTPTPIQQKAIPAAVDGANIIAIARTGSGKTLAFGIPMLQRLVLKASQKRSGIGLVLVPTRELAIQVEQSIRSISRSTGMSSVVLIGGAPMAPQQSALRRKPQIIIATPGRLMDHIERGTAKLGKVEMFVLDEADRMLDMGFMQDIRKVMKQLPGKYQMMLFSATMPKEIEAIAKTIMPDAQRIEIDKSGITPSKVSQEMFIISNHDKSRLLSLRLNECSGPALVFTRTKRMATKLALKVNNMGFATAEIHSDRSLGQRRHALEGFKRGKFQVLIATDIAARGIDVSDIELVVNYDLPANAEDYVHRIGRTGRAGKSGSAISFANTEQRGSIRSLERFMKIKLPISKLPILPSERFLVKQGEEAKANEEVTKGKGLSPNKLGRPRERNRTDFKKDYKKDYNKDSRRDSKRDFKSADGKPNSSARKDFKRDDSKRDGSKSYASKRTDFKRDDSRGADSRRVDSRSSDSRSADTRSVDQKSDDFKPKSSRRKTAKLRDKHRAEAASGTNSKKGMSLDDILSNIDLSKNRPSTESSVVDRTSKAKHLKQAAGEKSENKSGNSESYWSAFKKKRPNKKKSVGQGTGRNKRSKRK